MPVAFGTLMISRCDACKDRINIRNPSGRKPSHTFGNRYRSKSRPEKLSPIGKSSPDVVTQL